MCEFFTLQFWTVVQKPIAGTKYYQQKARTRQEAYEMGNKKHSIDGKHSKAFLKWYL